VCTSETLAPAWGKDFTVENIQNAWVHEYGQHFKANVPGGRNSEHAAAIKFQSNHPTWKKTTVNFKQNMRSVYKEYTGQTLNN
jgi:hypothetical protein